MGIYDRDYHVGGELNETGARTSRTGGLERDFGGASISTKERKRDSYQPPENKKTSRVGCLLYAAIGTYIAFEILDKFF